MTTYVLCKTLVPWLCSRSQPGIKVSIRGLSGAFVTYCNISCFYLSEVWKTVKVSDKYQGKVREYFWMINDNPERRHLIG